MYHIAEWGDAREGTPPPDDTPRLCRWARRSGRPGDELSGAGADATDLEWRHLWCGKHAATLGAGSCAGAPAA